MIKSFKDKNTQKVFQGIAVSVGQMLKSEFLEPMGLSQNALATAIGVPSNRINNIINGSRGITADTDLRLTKYFGLSEGFFLRYQTNIALLETKRKIAKALDQIVPAPTAVAMG